MSKFYLRRDPEPSESLTALAVALGVGGALFLLVRFFLARDTFEREAPKRLAGSGSDEAPAAGSAG